MHLDYFKKMKKIFNYILIAYFALSAVACKSDKTSGGLPKSNYDFYTHYRNFIIDKIQMSHVTIKGIPTNGHAIYMLQVYTTGCNPETRMRGKQVEGGHRLTYEDGCADTICRIEFKTKANRIVTPPPINLERTYWRILYYVTFRYRWRGGKTCIL